MPCMYAKEEAVALRAKLVADPGADLGAEEEKLQDGLHQLQLRIAQCQTELRREERELQQEEPRMKKARKELDEFGCDFGASEGKGNKSLIGQRANLERLHEAAVQEVEVAWRAFKEAAPADKAARVVDLDAAIEASQVVFVGCAKDLVVAFHHGWEVVKVMKGAAYAATEEEQKLLKSAIKTVEGKQKSKARPVTPAAVAGAGARAGGASRPVGAAASSPCYSCGVVGHWSRDCPGKK